MSTPFVRLTVSGCTLEGDAIPDWADALVRDHDTEWTRSLRDTVQELVTGDGAMTARTSGTTGPPKEMRFPAKDLMASAHLTGEAFHLRPGDTALLALPCNFIAGKMMLVRAFVLGLDLRVVPPQGDLAPLLGAGLTHDFAPLVGSQLARLLEHGGPFVDRHFGSILLGGGPVHGRLRHAIRGLSVPVHQGYGSTETLTHVALRRLNGAEEHDDYRACPGVGFRVDDEGRLIVRTPHLSTVEHRTSDLVELLDETRFLWLGRADEVILSRGRKLFPEDLEARSHSVLERPHAFFGEPDERDGQRVVLFLEPGPGEHDDDAVLERLKRVLRPHELPVRILRGPLPRTGTGKVQRARLRDQASGGLADT